MANDTLPNVWVVRADTGRYTQACVDGGYTGMGWNESGDLSGVTEREEIAARLPNEIGSTIGNLARFHLEIKAGDYVITPASDSQWLHYAEVAEGNPYYVESGDSACRYAHRRPVSWASEPLNRADFSNPPRCPLTVFRVHQPEEFLTLIGQDPARFDRA